MLTLISAALLFQTPKEFDLTILHTNDLHGHILPFAYVEKGKGPAEMPSVGGAARRATLVRKLKKSIHNPVLLVDSGDTFTRGPMTQAYEGVADAEAMNAVGYDLAALGNNEFKAKDASEVNDAVGAQAALMRVVKHSRFTWLCANATMSNGAFIEGVQPYVVRVIDGVRIGFLGLTAPRVASYPQAKGWTIKDAVSTAKNWIPKARKDCDVLIAITHIGFVLDQQLAAQTTGLDAIVGGDSHTYLYKLLEVKNPEGVTVPIVQDGEFGVRLGRFDLHFEKDASGKWHLAKYRDELLPVGPDLREAQDVLKVIEPFAAPLMKVVGKVDRVGKNETEREALTGQVVAKALRSQTRSDFALVRTDNFFETFRRPEVRIYDIHATIPFKNLASTADLTGSKIKELLKKKAIASAGPIGDIVDEKTYRVAFVDFDASDFFQIAGIDLSSTGLDVRDLIQQYLQDGGH